VTGAGRNRLTATALAGIIVAMLGLSAASVPLYALFCKVTGYGGTPRVASEVAAASGGDAVEVVVAFNADRDPKLPWTFRPLQREMRTRLGEEHLAFYEAVNRSDRAIVGRAVYNVTPHKVGAHFAKLECFCFQQQVLQPGERAELPVSFFVTRRCSTTRTRAGSARSPCRTPSSWTRRPRPSSPVSASGARPPRPAD
jgi:cytochrome c oxidase assembly protein subunit 11